MNLLLINIFLYSYFSAGILGSIGSFLAQKYYGPSALFLHGKSANLSCSRSQKWIASLVISKKYFWHFYAFGIIYSTAYYIKFGSNNLASMLLVIQCFRRLIECFWVMPGAKESNMHLIHYLIGVSYYPVLLISFNVQQQQQQQDQAQAQFYSKQDCFAFIVLFTAASILQSYCHWILGTERRNIKKESKSFLHRPVNHLLFKFIHTPHYTAEMLIYFSIAGVQRFPIQPLSYMNLLWIVSILGVSSKNSADWLCKTWKYKSSIEFCNYLLIPFLF